MSNASKLRTYRLPILRKGKWWYVRGLKVIHDTNWPTFNRILFANFTVSVSLSSRVLTKSNLIELIYWVATSLASTTIKYCWCPNDSWIQRVSCDKSQKNACCRFTYASDLPENGFNRLYLNHSILLLSHCLFQDLKN